MRIGYARNSKIWFSLTAKKKILSHENVDRIIYDLEDGENFKILCRDMKKEICLLFAEWMILEVPRTKSKIHGG
nr:MAG TPA: hypothetical protein [Caudoviricetes sp.]